MATMLVALRALPSNASYLVTFGTAKATSTTTLDGENPLTINFSVRPGTDPIDAIAGGFDVGRGPNTATDLTFTLWKGLDGWESPGAAVLASQSKGADAFTKDGFTATLFRLADLNLGAGDYSLALSSPARSSGSPAYTVRGTGGLVAAPAAGLLLHPARPVVVSEPAAGLTTAIGGAALGFFGLTRRRRRAAC
jgi:hypothetical protein